MKNKTFGWYLGAAIAGMLSLALAICIAAIVFKGTLMFILWLF